MALSGKQKILVYLAGVALGCAVLALFPDKPETGEHPWHAQTAPDGYFPLTVEDDYGRSVTLEKQPRWLVSLAPSITEMLFAMDLGDHLIAVTENDTYPEQARLLRDNGGNIGRMDAPNLEAITALRADLVIASNLTPSSVLERVNQGRTQAIALHHDSYDDIIEDIGQLGKILGLPGRALELQGAMAAKRAAIAQPLEAVADQPPRKAIVLLNIEDGLLPGWSPGKGTWMGDLIEMSHGENVAAALGASWGQMSLEGLVAADPAVIFVKDSNTAGAKERLRRRIAELGSHPVWSQLTAVRDGRVVIVPSGPFEIPGPRMVEAYAAIAAGLWPEVVPASSLETPDDV